MSNQDIVRAWKDEAYRQSLSDAQRAALPANPAGLVELNDADLDSAAGGIPPTREFTCTFFDCYTPILLCQYTSPCG